MENAADLYWVVVRWVIGAWALYVFLRWLLTPPHWRDGEGPLLDEGERMATEFSWVRWMVERCSLRFWRW